MDNQILLTILTISLIAILFILAAINSRQVPKRKRENVYKKLEVLKLQSESDDEFALRDTVIRLDNLLTKALQIKMGNQKSCGDNLKKAEKYFRKDKYQDIWDVHKLRNEIVHKDIDVSKEQVKNAYKIYKFSIEKLLK